jgi:hypothetical protein
LLPTLLVAALCMNAGAPAHAQPPYQPPYQQAPPVSQPNQQTGVSGRPTAPPASYQPPPVNPQQFVPDYSPYAGVPYVNPYGGGLTGAANAINAQGQFQIQYQQSRLMAQDVERSKIDTKRAQQEQWLWERNNLPTLEDNRQRDQRELLRQVLNDPPSTQIWNGDALNRILTAIQQVVPPGAPVPMVPLAPGLTARLSVTTGTTVSGIGLLKNGYKLQWPFALQGDAFTPLRTDIDKQIKTAYEQVSTGQVEAAVITKLLSDLDQLSALLKDMIEEMTPNQNIDGNRYVRELRSTVTALQQPNVAMFFAANRVSPADSVGQLVQNMSAQGQTFAPAVPGNEPAYTALHTAMVSFFKALTQPTVR